uniref:Uncharacterized protein n=1 Tax=Nelumbo nucifera TaxID=4432 RepID=A0A822YVU0_NELNU|nr:TPA_asm: hypothetical protein HUJ06_008855 [Nelumbo nucifera]
MHNSSTAPTTKTKVGSLLPTDASFKRKRGVFQKDRKQFLLILFPVNS